jgi:hypothetical protein
MHTLWKPRFKDFARNALGPLIYMGLTLFMFHVTEQSESEAMWASTGMLTVMMFAVLSFTTKDRPRSSKWRPVYYDETVADLVTGDAFYLRPAPSSSADSEVPDHPYLAGGLMKEGRRLATSLEDGQVYSLHVEREVRRVQASVKISTR